MPKIYDWLVTLLNKKSVPVSKALSDEFLTALDAQRLKNWQKKFEAAEPLLLQGYEGMKDQRRAGDSQARRSGAHRAALRVVGQAGQSRGLARFAYGKFGGREQREVA